jgi:hypothetical protein
LLREAARSLTELALSACSLPLPAEPSMLTQTQRVRKLHCTRMAAASAGLRNSLGALPLLEQR